MPAAGPELLGGSVHIRGVPLDDVLQAFLRRNVDYYRPIFFRMAREGAVFHVNYVALFFTPVWLAYRRFYTALAVLYAVPVAAFLPKSPFLWLVADPFSPSLLMRLLLVGPFIASVIFSSFGNFFLYHRFRRLVIDPSIPAERIVARVRNRGGPPGSLR